MASIAALCRRSISSGDTVTDVCQSSDLCQTTEGFYDTRPQRSGRRECHTYCTKGSWLEQSASVCRCLHRSKTSPKRTKFMAKRLSNRERPLRKNHVVCRGNFQDAFQWQYACKVSLIQGANSRCRPHGDDVHRHTDSENERPPCTNQDHAYIPMRRQDQQTAWNQRGTGIAGGIRCSRRHRQADNAIARDHPPSRKRHRWRNCQWVRRTRGSRRPGMGIRRSSASDTQRKVFTTPLLAEAKSDRNTEQFTKKKSRCQRGGVRGVAYQNATKERRKLQTKRCSKVEAAALRKNHVVRPPT